MIDKIIELFKRSKEETVKEVPEDICPNCWGQQKYGNQIRVMYEDKQIDVNNRSANHTFIKDFVITHINGIKLKKGNNGTECPTCKLIVQ